MSKYQQKIELFTLSNSPDIAAQVILKWANLEFCNELKFLRRNECFPNWSGVEVAENKRTDLLKMRLALPKNTGEDEEKEAKQESGSLDWIVDIFSLLQRLKLSFSCLSPQPPRDRERERQKERNVEIKMAYQRYTALMQQLLPLYHSY